MITSGSQGAAAQRNRTASRPGPAGRPRRTAHPRRRLQEREEGARHSQPAARREGLLRADPPSRPASLRATRRSTAPSTGCGQPLLQQRGGVGKAAGKIGEHPFQPVQELESRGSDGRLPPRRERGPPAVPDRATAGRRRPLLPRQESGPSRWPSFRAPPATAAVPWPAPRRQGPGPIASRARERNGLPASGGEGRRRRCDPRPPSSGPPVDRRGRRTGRSEPVTLERHGHRVDGEVPQRQVGEDAPLRARWPHRRERARPPPERRRGARRGRTREHGGPGRRLQPPRRLHRPPRRRVRRVAAELPVADGAAHEPAFGRRARGRTVATICTISPLVVRFPGIVRLPGTLLRGALELAQFSVVVEPIDHVGDACVGDETDDRHEDRTPDIGRPVTGGVLRGEPNTG